MTTHPINFYQEHVRFEDVDAAAIVYHPVYLTYVERARSHRLREEGYNFKRLLDEKLSIVMAATDMKYVRPLRLDDNFIVASQVNDFGKSIITMTQVIAPSRDDFDCDHLQSQLRRVKNLCFYAHIKLVVVSQETMRPTAIPAWLMDLLIKTTMDDVHA